MAQLNITLNQEEIQQLLTNDRNESKPFMIMSQYTTNENVPDVWYNHPSVRLIDRRKSLSER